MVSVTIGALAIPLAVVPTIGAAPALGAGVPPGCAVRSTFGTMFPDLPAATWSRAAVDALSTASIADEELQPTAEGKVDDEENEDIPAGETYVGQFVDHDLTLNPEAANLAGTLDPATLVNQRTPKFDLDSVYGSGPAGSPRLFATDGMHLLLGAPLAGARDAGAVDQLRDGTGQAVIGDGRNDENRLVASLHTLVMRFHNQEVDRIRQANPALSAGAVFDRARQQTQWAYQYAVLTDFLPSVAGAQAVASVLPSVDASAAAPRLTFYDPCGAMAMPVEFSVAAYRFGHSLVRPIYRINDTVDRLPVFDASMDPTRSLVGFGPSPSDFAVDWSFLLPIDGRTKTGHPQASYRIDPSLTFALGLLPLPESGDGVNNLASRNLLRAEQLGLASGQDVARALGVRPLRDDQILVGKATGDKADTRAITAVSPEFAGKAPLWTYILAEAIAQSFPVSGGIVTGTQKAPVRLGPVGGRIVTEVLVGLMAADRSSVLYQPGFRPDPAIAAGDGTLGFAQLIAAVDGSDLARGRPVTPSGGASGGASGGSAGAALAAAVDGSLATGAAMVAGSSVTVDLGRQFQLQRAQAVWAGRPPARVTLEGAASDGVWRTLWSGPGQQANLAIGQFDTVRRIRVTASSDGTLAALQAFRQSVTR